jgi:anti-anti-sigma factor
MNDQSSHRVPQGPLVVTCDQKEYDISTCNEFLKILAPTFNAPSVIVDMSRVEYLDSSCLSKLVLMRQRRREAGFKPARLVIKSRKVMRLFEVTSFDKMWAIFDSLTSALNSSNY